MLAAMSPLATVSSRRASRAALLRTHGWYRQVAVSNKPRHVPATSSTSGVPLNNRQLRKCASSEAVSALPEDVVQPSLGQLRRYALQCAVPMIGFGFIDNLIMIQAGELIEATIGQRFGLATLTAAAMGQVCSDVSGVCFGGVLDALFSKLGLPPHGLTSEQLGTQIARFVRISSMAIGVVFGCILGMGSLLFMDLEHEDRMARQADLQKIFKTLAEDGKSTLNVESITLQILDVDKEHLWTLARSWTPTVAQIEEHIAAIKTMMTVENNRPVQDTDIVSLQVVHRGFRELGWENAEIEVMIPKEQFTLKEYEKYLSTHLASRPVRVPLKVGGTKDTVMRTGEILNLEDLYDDDRFIRARRFKKSSQWRTKSVLVGPVFDSDKEPAEAYGIIEMINKKDDHGEIVAFTQADEKFMKLLCSHCACFIAQATKNSKEGHKVAELSEFLQNADTNTVNL